MNGKIKILRLCFLLSIFVISLLTLTTGAFGITASLSNPRMVLRVNVSKNAPAVITKTITISNNNDYDVDVILEPDETLRNLGMELSETTFSMAPNTSKDINFKLTVKKTGFFEGRLYITYRGTPLNSTRAEQIGLAAFIGVIATGENYSETPSNKHWFFNNEPHGNSFVRESETKGANPLIGVLIMLFIIIVGVGLFLKFRR